jgi:mannose/cellobiose epimerase-like protein (N-acyl-D-glucosamine 2-epimerase family)
VLNLTEPTGLFEARDFQIRDGDTLYVTEAPFVQWQKTLGAITGIDGRGVEPGHHRERGQLIPPWRAGARG